MREQIKTEESKIFVASDGHEFTSERLALRYEAAIKRWAVIKGITQSREGDFAAHTSVAMDRGCLLRYCSGFCYKPETEDQARALIEEYTQDPCIPDEDDVEDLIMNNIGEWIYIISDDDGKTRDISLLSDIKDGIERELEAVNRILES